MGEKAKPGTLVECGTCGDMVPKLVRCDTCGIWNCEECGRTVVKHAGSVRRTEKWECVDCEFGGQYD